MTPSTSAPALLPAHSWLQALPVAWWRQYWLERCLSFGEGTLGSWQGSPGGRGWERSDSESWAKPEERGLGEQSAMEGDPSPSSPEALLTGKCTQGDGAYRVVGRRP